MNILLLGVVMLVATLTTILTMSMETEQSMESFVPNIFDRLTNEENAKLKFLSDTSKFKFNQNSGNLEIIIPARINTGELRIIGKNPSLIFGSNNLNFMNGSEIVTPNKNKRYLEINTNDNKKIFISPIRYKYSYRIQNSYIGGYPIGYYYGGNVIPTHYKSLDMALYKCDSNPYCQGVTYNPNLQGYSLRGGNIIVTPTMNIETKASPYGEHSYIKRNKTII
jgi:hypothetical protein